MHRRHDFGPLGDISVLSVRLSNLIAANFATFIELLHQNDRKLFFLVEQPGSSWLWKMSFFASAISLLALQRVHTWMAFFGHDMQKSTDLYGNIPLLSSMKRVMTKSARVKFQQRFEKRQSRRKTKKEYTVKGKDGRVHGGKDLAGSAAYTQGFAAAVFRLWLRAAHDSC